MVSRLVLDTTNTSTTSIEVDVIIPVHNAALTVEEAVLSALHQEIPGPPSSSQLLRTFLEKYTVSVTVCCYNDGSSDESLEILRRIEACSTGTSAGSISTNGRQQQLLIPSRLIVRSGKDGEGRGAGYARNRAVEMNNPCCLLRVDCDDDDDDDDDDNDNDDDSPEAAEINKSSEKNSGNTSKNMSGGTLKFLCFLDSDDTMHKHRVIEQALYMMALVDDDETRNQTILGCTFDRDPPDSTWHYSRWANNLSDERLVLEKYREITILQPTWFMPLAVWSRVGGYIEAPAPGSSETVLDVRRRFNSSSSSQRPCCLVHPKYDTLTSLRLAEDLRFFHSHLDSNGKLRLHRTALATTISVPVETTMTPFYPLVTYRHSGNYRSQSFRTSRKLLLQLRAYAFQNGVIREVKDVTNNNNNNNSLSPTLVWNNKFVIWGCGRDGKDFFKALDRDLQERVYCFVDVDAKKLNAGYYQYVVDDDSTAPPRRSSVVKSEKEATKAGKKQQKGSSAARKIPIVHYSFLIPDQNERESVQNEWMTSSTTTSAAEGDGLVLGRIDKSKPGSVVVVAANANPPPKLLVPVKKKRKQCSAASPSPSTAKLQNRGLDQDLLSCLPVVVCVAMYRTNGVLESNVTKIGRTEGKDLWHFS